jgi:hypothetical protein
MLITDEVFCCEYLFITHRLLKLLLAYTLLYYCSICLLVVVYMHMMEFHLSSHFVLVTSSLITITGYLISVAVTRYQCVTTTRTCEVTTIMNYSFPGICLYSCDLYWAMIVMYVYSIDVQA